MRCRAGRPRGRGPPPSALLVSRPGGRQHDAHRNPQALCRADRADRDPRRRRARTRWYATTFVSRDVSADLPALSGEDLSALTMIPRHIVVAWAADEPEPLPGGAHAALRGELRRIPTGSPALSFMPTAAAGDGELRVALPRGTLIIVRAGPNEGHGARLRALAWLPGALTHPGS